MEIGHVLLNVGLVSWCTEIGRYKRAIELLTLLPRIVPVEPYDSHVRYDGIEKELKGQSSPLEVGVIHARLFTFCWVVTREIDPVFVHNKYDKKEAQDISKG